MKEKKNVSISTEKEKRIFNSLVPIVLVLILELFFKICIKFVVFYRIQPMIFSIIIGYIIYGIGLSISGKTSGATIFLSIFSFLLLLINQIKIIYTGEPIFLSDINFIKEIKDLTNMLSTNFIFMLLKYLIYFIILAVVYFIIIKVAKDNDLKIEKIRNRIFIFLICIILICLLFIPNNTTKKIYLNIFLGANTYKDYNSYTTSLSYYATHTFLAGIYGTELNNRFSEPDNYDENMLNELLKKAETNTFNNKNLGKPNIILVFSESFWDLEKLQEVTFDKDVTRNLNKLKKEGKSIELLSCTYGGLSENVAFELLTGGNMLYFPNGYIPVMSLYKRSNSEGIPSIVKELKNNGYSSKIIMGKDYYDSEESFLCMGFDKYIEVEDTMGIENVSDEGITDIIIEEFESKEREERIFYMVETIQNHMPYEKNKYEEYDIQIESSNLNEDMKETLLSYAQGVYDADEQLNRLYEYIQEYEEPTIIIFLGDHLPYLYTNRGKNVLDNFEYFNTEDETENNYRKYNTEAIILSNYDIECEEFPKYLSNDLLLTYLINNMDIEISNYYKWLYTTINDLPASNKFVSIDSKGEKYNTKNLSEKMKQIYELKELMQYKFFIKAGEK